MMHYLESEINWIYIILAVAYLAICGWFLYERLKKDRQAKITKGHFALLGLILVGPPVWFLFEYNHLFLPFARDSSHFTEDFEVFKYNQESAAKVWAGVATLVVAVALKKEPDDSESAGKPGGD